MKRIISIFISFSILVTSCLITQSVFAQTANHLAHGVLDEDCELSTDLVINNDIYIKKNVTLTVSSNVIINGDVYVFGTLINNKVLTVNGTIYALKYNSMFSAGNYNYGIVKNNGKLHVDNLTINDSYLSVQVPAIVHDWKLAEKVESGCNYNGYEKYICSVCQEEKYITSASKGHNFSSNSEYCLNGCGTANPNYVAPIQPTPTPTPAPTPTPTPTQPTQTSKPVAKPKSAKIKKVKAAKKAIAVEWKKVSGVKGYQIQVATDKKFKKNKKTVTVKKQKTTKVTVKKLKAKKKYYVRIRTYKTVKGKKVYSSWSKVKTVKTK